jgi:hypothetical protein
MLFGDMPTWAYDFECDNTLDGIASLINRAGPWTWQARDSYWYGDYLNTRPAPGLRVRIHQYPQTVGTGQQFTGPREHGFMALLELSGESAVTRGEIDAIFRELLARIGAVGLTAVEPYD